MSLTSNTNLSLSAVDAQSLSCEDLYQKYSGALYGIIKNTVADSFTAETMLEQVFVKIHNCKNECAAQISFLTWAIQQTLTIVKQYRDGEAPCIVTDSNKKSYISTPKEHCETDDYCNHVFDLVLQGYNANNISGLLQIPLKTVTKCLRAGIKLKANNP